MTTNNRRERQAAAHALLTILADKADSIQTALAECEEHRREVDSSASVRGAILDLPEQLRALALDVETALRLLKRN